MEIKLQLPSRRHVHNILLQKGRKTRHIQRDVKAKGQADQRSKEAV